MKHYLRTFFPKLLMAVVRKWPGESRHDTALRYIRECERTTNDAASAMKEE